MEFKEADMSYLRDITGGEPSMMKEMIRLFLDQTPQDLNKLKLSIAAADWQQTHVMAHHIKPTLSYMGANAMRAELQQIEDWAKSGQPPVSLQGDFDKLQQRFEVLFAELETYIAVNLKS